MDKSSKVNSYESIKKFYDHLVDEGVIGSYEIQPSEDSYSVIIKCITPIDYTPIEIKLEPKKE